MSTLPFGASTLEHEPVRAVLFDLDGTLLDTAEDIRVALNRALAEQQTGPLALQRVRDLIGRGAPVLVQRVIAGLQPRPWPVDPVLLLQRFYYHYDRMHENHECRARPYPGVEEGLAQLHDRGLRIAVVTNKPRLSAATLLEQLGLSQWIDLVVGGDTLEQRKPDPQPLRYACETLQVSASQAIMVGDSATDVLAARAAGLRVVCVPYGYNEGADPRTLPCDAFVDSIDALPRLLFAAPLPTATAANDALAHPGK